MLYFYTGDFETVRRVSINPQGLLGWSTSFIQYGLRAIGYLRLVLYKIYSGFFYIKLKLFLLEPEMK